jgi:hypothetical protein
MIRQAESCQQLQLEVDGPKSVGYDNLVTRGWCIANLGFAGWSTGFSLLIQAKACTPTSRSSPNVALVFSRCLPAADFLPPAVTTCFVTPPLWPLSETTWPIIVTVAIFFERLRADSARWSSLSYLNLP